jgi:hypothetical protein
MVIAGLFIEGKVELREADSIGALDLGAPASDWLTTGREGNAFSSA